MKQWNILATAQWRHERHLLRLLNQFGEFRGSGYRDVILGYVEDVQAFLETLDKARREDPERFWPLGQIVPVERNFQFDVSDFEEKAENAIAPYINQLEGTKFYVK